jgi:hypothetical protein
VTASAVPFHGRPFSVTLTLPPLAILFLRSDGAPSASQAAPSNAAERIV